MAVKITALPLATIPISGDELMEVVQAGFSRKLPIGQAFGNVTGDTPTLFLIETDAPANNRVWGLRSLEEELQLLAMSDDGLSTSNILTATRTNHQIDDVSLAASGVLTLTGASLVASGPLTAGSGSVSSLASGDLALTSASPSLYLNESDGTLNNKLWRMIATGETLLLQSRTDANGAGTTFWQVDRTGTGIDSVTHPVHSQFTLAGTPAIPSLLLSSTQPIISLNETDAAANNRKWDFATVSEQLVGRLVDDSGGSTASWIVVDRTANTPDLITLNSPVTITGTNLRITNSGTPTLFLNDSGQSVDERLWRINVANNLFQILTRSDDDVTLSQVALQVTRATNVNVSGITLGNSSGNPQILLDGRVTVGGTGSVTGLANGNLVLTGTDPILYLNETDAAADNRLWRLLAGSESFALQARLDNNAGGSTAFSVVRTGASFDSFNFFLAIGATLPITSTATANAAGNTYNLNMDSSVPFLQWRESDAAANNRRWQMGAEAEQLRLQAVDDAGATNSVFTVDRTGNVVDNITFPSQVIGTFAQTAGPATSAIYLNSSAPGIGFNESDAAADNRLWDILANGTALTIRLSTDAGSAANFLTLSRSGNTCTQAVYQTDLHSFRNAANTERVRFAGAGNSYFPGVGTTASAANAVLNNGSTPANELLRSTSSVRYKTDIQDLSSLECEQILTLRPITFRSLSEADDPNVRWYGLVAEEVAQVFPRMVNYFPSRDEGLIPDGVQYDRLTVLMLKYLQGLALQVQQLSTRMDER